MEILVMYDRMGISSKRKKRWRKRKLCLIKIKNGRKLNGKGTQPMVKGDEILVS